MSIKNREVPWFIWPFYALWLFIAGIVQLTGRLVAIILGFVFMLVGVLLTITIIGAFIGVPMALLGLLLFLRGIF